MSSIQQALQTLGTDLGGIFGGGNQGFTQFGSVDPTQQMGINAALQQNPSLAALQGQVASVGPTPQTPNFGPIGQLYLQYLMQKRLQQRSAPGFGVPSAQQPPFNPFVGGAPAAITPPQVQL